MSIYRLSSGLILDNSFNTNQGVIDQNWSVSPSNSLVTDQENFQSVLNHSKDTNDVYALMDLPEDEPNLVFQVQAAYVPKELGDEGGIVLWKNSAEKIEFLESEDSSKTSEYSFWRATRHQNLWTFFAKRGIAWEMFDSAIIEPTKIGLTLKGNDRLGYVPMGVQRVTICRGSNISVGNLLSESKVELYDSMDNLVDYYLVPKDYSGVDIALPSIPFDGYLKAYEKNEDDTYTLVSEQEEVATMYGGDVFLKGTDLKVLYDGKELSEITPTNLGTVKNNKIEKKMTVLNDTVGSIAEEVELQVAVYMDDFGWVWCDLALDEDGVPGEYQDTTIQIGTLNHGESRDFWVKITKPEVLDEEMKHKMNIQMRPTHFYLNVMNY